MSGRGWILLAATHVVALAIGFGAGVYTLPILIAPAAPTGAEVQSRSQGATYSGEFRRGLRGSDAFHWGEGRVTVGPDTVTLLGEIAPGPDYKLYLSPKFVETEDEVQQLKPRMLRVGDVKTFSNFVVPLPQGVDLAQYDTVLVWCETFSQFITAAKYR